MGKIILSTVLSVKIMYRAVCVLLLSFSLIIGVALTVSAQGYPVPPPDFAHPATPHYPLYSPYGGSLSRPLLVIYRQFTDVSPDPSHDSAWAAQRFFGPDFPNLHQYYLFNSFCMAMFTPARETEGTVNDGIVVVNTGITADAWWAMSDGDMRKTGLEGADPFVNFASFDTNLDGIVTNEELLVVQMHVARNPSENCGATRWSSPVTLDEKQIILPVAQGTEITNLITHIHEVGHIAFDTTDFYGYYHGLFDPYGPTCGLPDDTFVSYNAYNKLHLGWIHPTVVTRDGFYEIHDAGETGEAFILYDYDRGTNDYFVVENRRRDGLNVYDQSISDEGLVIWKIDEAVFANPDPNIKMIDLVRPARGFAWDPSDAWTPERTMEGNWRDGTPSRVAVRAIGPRGPVIRAYFDVRGPGILVDPSTATGTPIEIEIMRGEMSLIAVPIMNTGEAWDEFEFTIVGLPADWVVTTQRLDLAPGIPTTASIFVKAPADAALGGYAVQAQGISITDPSVHTMSPLTITTKLMPDLIETFVSNPPASVGRGESFSVTDTVKNRGDAACGESTTFYYLSLNHKWNATDKQLTGTRTIPGLVAGQSHTGTVLVSVPNDTSPAAYYLLACADFAGAQSEGNETNNCIASKTRVQVIALPDYVEAYVSNPPKSARLKDSFKVEDTVKNKGAVASNRTSTTRYYLVSTLQTKTARKWLLKGGRTVDPLDPGEISPGEAIVYVPKTIPLGWYHVMACADDTKVIDETVEKNNCTVSTGTIQITK
jgi:M6 family metalloprotease-like protein